MGKLLKQTPAITASPMPARCDAQPLDAAVPGILLLFYDNFLLLHKGL
jgi:hypothetical protein